MPIFKVFTTETKEVEMEYDVEAADETAAADMIDFMRDMSDDSAEQYMQDNGIEANLESYGSAASQLKLDGVERWGR